MDKMTVDPSKSIPAFYAGQSILLTGGTGFLGKVFIEKVLRSCPDVREIFLLMRPKKGLSIKERLSKILNLPLFEKLREERPSNFEKLIVISGDASEKNMGLSATDRQMLVERVTIIIHAAASVRFNNSLKYAIFANTRATRDICILAQNMKNLIALVYVSTAFAHMNEPFVDEKVYLPIADWQKIIEIVETSDEHTLNVFTAKCLDYAPNTYIFSKNLAEKVIQDYSSSLPCAIVRPSIVASTFQEPFPGWLDNVYGPIGITIGAGKGIIRVMYTNGTINEDFVPVDIVIKIVIIVTWKVGLTTYDHSITDSAPLIVNCTSIKYFTYQDCANVMYTIANEVPFEATVWTPYVIFTPNFVLFYILTMLLHILPAILIDLILKFTGHQPMLVQLQRRVYVASCAVSYFTFHELKCNNANRLTLMSLVPQDNVASFFFDVSTFDIRTYCKNCAIGAKKFLLHEDMNRLDAAKAHNKRVYLLVTIVKTITFIGLLWIIYKWIFFGTL
ncbi:PREDICTED: fatty acyl-CoA reductase 1-like isoform X1 [Trachymyrmex septentrionalis]|uniref:fatty acyl-CoA reductase 1-like isoform X1 n=2 Tax=Trachymyrmex septentrionalis TaxID=34720 RepID=UPI00084F0022|nr:PREDICTED: fatty acyl-CoA reductase 1-like isoform X1 [Trachymyrmex septentrionalis]